jgi:hypothetical protein
MADPRDRSLPSWRALGREREEAAGFAISRECHLTAIARDRPIDRSRLDRVSSAPLATTAKTPQAPPAAAAGRYASARPSASGAMPGDRAIPFSTESKRVLMGTVLRAVRIVLTAAGTAESQCDSRSCHSGGGGRACAWCGQGGRERRPTPVKLQVANVGADQLIKISREKGHTRGHSCDLVADRAPICGGARTP